ncbi:type VI secretion system-associated protein TagF [Sphingomonas arantia]|uniref:Type VI secretion system-associated protein TagF n=1 Tax=Sphingomonas arantia TaxID=1460676 RepID=A0ABW4TXQ6_9SPHN
MRGFLFGKLPAFGDFVSRGLSVSMRSWWDRWCSEAVLDARVRLGDDFEARCLATAPRRFLVAPLADCDPWQAGCLHASSDRSGRVFPFVLGVAASERIDATDAVLFGERLASCAERAFAPQVDLDALISAAEHAAGTAAAGRPLEPIVAGDRGWIGGNVHELEN